ncbi:MAG: metallophosphoesterase [Solirubrobacteraceae bacterium]
MRTLIISDLHLGSNSGIDLLRRPEMRARLIEALDGVDRLVLLGDVLELRHGPLREAMAAARPFFEEVGRALGDRELIVTAGNHDHALVEPWLAARGAEFDPGPLRLEHLLEPGEVSPAMARIAEWSAPASVRVAYPGLWVRPDVYAMHGHYLDCHLTVPTLERLSVGVMSRLLGLPASGFEGADDYEAMGAPVFAWRDVVARHTHPGAALNGMATVSAWRALGGGGSERDSGAGTPGSITERLSGRLVPGLRRRALLGAFPLAVGALNRAGLGPLRADISAAELRRAGLAAMGEVAARLSLGEQYVVFGHTHRAGPLEGDLAGEWRGPAGARLVNSGSWTYAAIFLDSAGPANPYWPGSAVLVGEDGPPELLRLLIESTRGELAPARR